MRPPITHYIAKIGEPTSRLHHEILSGQWYTSDPTFHGSYMCSYMNLYVGRILFKCTYVDVWYMHVCKYVWVCIWIYIHIYDTNAHINVYMTPVHRDDNLRTYVYMHVCHTIDTYLRICAQSVSKNAEGTVRTNVYIYIHVKNQIYA